MVNTTLCYTLLWFTCSIGISVVYRIAGHYFHFNGLLTSNSLFIQGALVSLYLYRLPKVPDYRNLLFVSVVVSQSFYIFLSNLSLQFVPIYIAVIFKCLVPFFNLVLNTSSLTLKTVFYSIDLSIGIFLSVWNGTTIFNRPKDYEIVGYVLCILACLFNVLRFNVLKKYLDTFEEVEVEGESEVESEVESNREVTLDVICDTYPVMSMVLTPFGIVSSSIQTWDMTSLSWFVIFTGACSFLGLFLTIGELKVLKRNSVFFTTVLEILKETILLVGSGLIEDELTLVNWVGVLLIITSILNIKLEL